MENEKIDLIASNPSLRHKAPPTNTKIFIMIGTLLPIVYLWSLPILKEIGFAFDGQTYF